eukprot:PhM_4_TR7267/c0_g1_i2/m.39274
MSLIFVRHHDDQITSFNSNTRNVVLLHHISKTLNYPNVTSIDLITNTTDAKTMNPVGLIDKPDVYCKDVTPAITTRGTYVAVAVKEDEDGVREYTVLLQGEEANKMQTLLDARATEDRKKAAGGKGKKK